MKKFIEAIFAWLGVLWIVISPFTILIASVLSTVKWYSLSNSVIQGVVGFVVGGLVSGLVMGIGLAIILVVVYYIQKENI